MTKPTIYKNKMNQQINKQKTNKKAKAKTKQKQKIKYLGIYTLYVGKHWTKRRCVAGPVLFEIDAMQETPCV